MDIKVEGGIHITYKITKVTIQALTKLHHTVEVIGCRVVQFRIVPLQKYLQLQFVEKSVRDKRVRKSRVCDEFCFK